MKLNKNELSGYWFKADRETFYALLKAGYDTTIDDYPRNPAIFAILKSNSYIIYRHSFDSKEIQDTYKQAYHHNGEFYTIDGEWLMDADAQGKGVPFNEPELTYGEQVNTAHGLDEPIATIKKEILAELTKKEGSNHLVLSNPNGTSDAYINGELFCKYSHNLIPHYANELGFNDTPEAKSILLEGKSAALWVTIENGKIKYWQQTMVWNRALTVEEINILTKNKPKEVDEKPFGESYVFWNKDLSDADKDLLKQDGYQEINFDGAGEYLSTPPMPEVTDKWQSITDYIDSRPAEQKEGARLMLERLKPEMERLEIENKIKSDAFDIADSMAKDALSDLKRCKKLKGTEKKPFPALEDLENFEIAMVEFPKWWPTTDIQLGLGWCKNKEVYERVCKEFYLDLKALHENSKDFTVAWKLKEKHTITCAECGTIWEGETACSAKQAYGSYCSPKCADRADIKAQYAEAKEAEKNDGPIVKLEYSWGAKVDWYETDSFSESKSFLSCAPQKYDYRLKFYEIDWNKVLETSYRDGEFVECEFSDDILKDSTGPLTGVIYADNETEFVNDKTGCCYENCKIIGEIKDEWLKEVEK